MPYIYRMYVDDEVKYIGKTKDMRARMSNHFIMAPDEYGSRVLTMEQAKSVTKVEYTYVHTKSNAVILEAYLIAKNKPEWNKEYVEDDELTFELETGDLEWEEWKLYLDDNPDHLIRISKDGVLLYEIPKVHSVYDPLCKKLGITQDMMMPFGFAIENNGYTLVRITRKRKIVNGSMVKKPKYRYPEGEDGEHENTNENDQIGE